MIKAQVFTILKGNTTAYDGKDFYLCDIVGRLKQKGQASLKVGDYVELEKNNFAENKYIITNILPRKNSLIRPSIANLDQLIIVISSVPKPDLYLVDALLIYCKQHDIYPVIVLNKLDLFEKSFIDNIKAEYNNVVDKVLPISAKTGTGIKELEQILGGKLSAFAGQSAVGKSSILNAMAKDLNIPVQEVSHKIQRGKHTTRSTEIYLLGDMLIADTPGFSMLDLIDFKFDELKYYYNDFVISSNNCKYTGCNHINAKASDCGVIKDVQENRISNARYQRYLKFFKDLKEKNEYD